MAKAIFMRLRNICEGTEQICRVFACGAGNMVEYLDFFNIYMIGLIEGGFQFYFLAKILKKKLLYPFYFLFGVCSAGRNDVYSSFMNLLSLQYMFREIAECAAVDDFEIMDKFNPQKLEENVDVFDQALNKYLAEYEKAGICPRHFENVTEFVENYQIEKSC